MPCRGSNTSTLADIHKQAANIMARAISGAEESGKSILSYRYARQTES